MNEYDRDWLHTALKDAEAAAIDAYHAAVAALRQVHHSGGKYVACVQSATRARQRSASAAPDPQKAPD